jgi:LacI family repressor for deo operon, udp, cdd, tsx, nupC, and nupG
MTGPPEAGAWTIRADAMEMAEQATQYLLQLRHRRIALLDSLTGYEQGGQRTAGYLRALVKAGLGKKAAITFTPRDCEITPADGFDFAVQGVRSLLAMPKPPTAFLTMSDEAGLAVLHELSARGLKVHEQVSVISFDDSRYCLFSNPPLTVISVPYRKIGMEAASIVHRQLEGKGRQKPHLPNIVSGDLVIRRSSGPAPA